MITLLAQFQVSAKFSFVFFWGRAPQFANTQASCSKQAAQAKPKGLLRLLCAGSSKLQNNLLFPLSPEFYVDPACARLRRQLYK